MTESHDPGVSRRRFLRQAALGAAGAGALWQASCQPSRPPAATPPPAKTPPPPPQVAPPTTKGAADAPAGPVNDAHRVVVVRHSGVTRNSEVQEDVLAQMVDRAVQELCGEQSAPRAWQRYFSSDERVGVKVNGLGGPSIATSVLLTKICVERLQGIGVKPENIIIWDSNPGFLAACGLQPGTQFGAQVMSMDVEWGPVVTQGSFKGPLTAIVTKRVDAILNLPIMKNHGGAAITLAMKNHYGSHQNPGDHHANQCDPYIADLNTIPAIRDKHRLVLCDATRGMAEGGPGYNPKYFWCPNTVLAAKDCVAHDTVGWQMIDAQRATFGLGPVAGQGQQPKQLASAAQRGLGTNDLKEIDRAEVELG